VVLQNGRILKTHFQEIIYNKKKYNNMKHLKTFESFSTNESKSIEDIKSKIDSLSESELDKVKEDLSKLANELGLSESDLTDSSKVEAALAKSKLELDINEGFIGDLWNKAKGKFYKFLTAFGVTGMTIGLITTAIGAEMASSQTNLADFSGSTVDANTAVIVGGAAMAISLIATIIGMSKN
jgi:hypothetical protein